jgi:hypothetical protein
VLGIESKNHKLQLDRKLTIGEDILQKYNEFDSAMVKTNFV